jgi:hypothetical protein
MLENRSCAAIADTSGVADPASDDAKLELAGKSRVAGVTVQTT